MQHPMRRQPWQNPTERQLAGVGGMERSQPQFFTRSYAGRYQQQNPVLDALIRRREAQEDYRRRFGDVGMRR